MTKPLKINSFLQRIETNSTWQDFISLSQEKDQIKELEKWLNDDKSKEHGKNRSHLALFCGTSGSTKTLAANLLGKYSKRDVYQIDSIQMISKYIGETEKNLSAIFDRAKSKNWILFFDEADALFGKRTKVSETHNEYANQEVSYFMQKIENHAGLVILSVVACKNIDKRAIKNIDTIIEI